MFPDFDFDLALALERLPVLDVAASLALIFLLLLIRLAAGHAIRRRTDAAPHLQRRWTANVRNLLLFLALLGLVLIWDAIAAACDGRFGEVDPAAAIERDLTGYGQADFILSHEGVSCAGGGASLFCGQLCSVMIYVRRGGLLHLEREMLVRSVSVGAGPVPPISMYALGGKPAVLKWSGQSFGPANWKEQRRAATAGTRQMS